LGQSISISDQAFYNRNEYSLSFSMRGVGD
jgi:hypothetical protein